MMEHGDTAAGANWPNQKDRLTRFDVMLDVIRRAHDEPITLCDLGCGTGELLTRIRTHGPRNVTYIGVDRSALALSHARRKFPDVKFLELDVTARGANLSAIDCDFVVANGLFTVKSKLTQTAMWSFMEATVHAVWPHVRRGIAFNVMSKVVDWERDDLFHVPMDELGRLLHGLAGRNVRYRADYGLYEYTAYAYRAGASQCIAAAPPPQKIPVMRPLLPSTDRLLPYLRRMDAARTYSNWGPLVREFEAQLAANPGLRNEHIVSASSGTIALVGAAIACCGKVSNEKPYAIAPAFTFVGTAALERCGYNTYLADVDPQSWALDPQALLDRIDPSILKQTALVMPVAPFGRPVAQEPWLRFRDKTGIPVVIDAAAAFDRIATAPQAFIGDIPVMLSLHATKSLGVGEGGCIVSTNAELSARMTQALNYGFRNTRESRSAGTNGKMSEYHAAVGLAELDGWNEKQASYLDVARGYREEFTRCGCASALVTAPDISLTYVLYDCGTPAAAEQVTAALANRGVEHRMWYGDGLHRHSHYASLPREANLAITDDLAPRLVGLPMSIDLTQPEIARVAAAIAEAQSS
jgi:dTDP-4-amino-4,6-dideoxygalactose transaminase